MDSQLILIYKLKYYICNKVSGSNYIHKYIYIYNIIIVITINIIINYNNTTNNNIVYLLII